ncbi:hypothetical protein [Acinetobacter sp. HY1485]|uniref:hypothetical protein n=1 Tax=Acinetobacter sp. HY1485 TaxID=2970918 RepID=UPI0022B9AD9E|nr:hypothetical protein [Acinetobacter sp. HY1485]
MRQRYKAPFSAHHSFFTSCQKKELSTPISDYEKNKKLKSILLDLYSKSPVHSDVDFWIVKEWGGIRSFKETSNNIEKIAKFKQQSKNRKLTIDTFDVISSLSKIASCLKPDDFFIYDSRAIFALNW